MTSTFLDIPWKVDYLGAIQWTLRRKTNSIQISWGGRDDQMMNQWSEDNMVQRKIISEWAHSDQLKAMMFKNNLWSSKPRQQLRVKMYLKDIFISSSWFIISNMAMTMLSHDCFWMNVGRMHRTHLDWPWDHLFWSSNAHFTAWVWEIKATSLMRSRHFFSQFVQMSWEELIEKEH
jgi:hypothetical protein